MSITLVFAGIIWLLFLVALGLVMRFVPSDISVVGAFVLGWVASAGVAFALWVTAEVFNDRA